VDRDFDRGPLPVLVKLAETRRRVSGLPGLA